MDSAMVASFMVLLLAFPTVFATDFNVGDDSGWNTGVDYTAWTSGKTFKVGDNLVFKYSSSLHQVDEVDESGYNGCSSSNTLKNYNDGNSKVPLSKAGKIYFICPTPGHCSANGGMKLEVNVVAAGTTPTPSGTPPTSPSSGSSPPTTPSGSTTSSPPPPKPSDSGAISVSSGISLLIGSFMFLAFMG